MKVTERLTFADENVCQRLCGALKDYCSFQEKTLKKLQELWKFRLWGPEADLHPRTVTGAGSPGSPLWISSLDLVQAETLRRLLTAFPGGVTRFLNVSQHASDARSHPERKTFVNEAHPRGEWGEANSADKDWILQGLTSDLCGPGCWRIWTFLRGSWFWFFGNQNSYAAAHWDDCFCEFWLHK